MKLKISNFDKIFELQIIYIVVITRVQIVKNELGGSATQQELRGWGSWGSQWNEQGNWGVIPQRTPSIRTLVITSISN